MAPRRIITHAVPAMTGRAAVAWAKSLEEGAIWMPLWRHLEDAGRVADAMWESRISPGQRMRLARLLDDEVLGQRLAVWLAAAHDVGKVSAAFASKVPALRERMEREGFRFPALTGDAQRRAPHGVVGQLAVEDWLEGRGVRRLAGRRLSPVIGGHHGIFPGEEELAYRSGGLEALRGEGAEWSETRSLILDRAAALAGLDDAAFDRIGAAQLDAPTLSMMTGYLIFCDWIASNADLFPVHAGPDGQDTRAEVALSRLRLPEPWRPRPPADVRALFAERFDLPPTAEVRPSQAALVEAAEALSAPGFLLLEAPTGEGKTEAALAAAETLAARFGASGVFVALPTRATSDAMFSRVLSWLDRALPPGETAAAVLSHGKAEFNEDYQSLAHALPNFAPTYDDEGGRSPAAGAPSLVAHWWLRGRKTSALADFAVGTIDQVLFAGLRARHVVLRHLGLGGKILILDELHAADTYMATYLKRALEWLGALGVGVIGLSATMPPARRLELLAAYERGTRIAAGERLLDDAAPTEALRDAAEAEGYPLITAVAQGGALSRPAAASRRASTTALELLGDDDQIVARVLADSADGGCVAVVHNTVARAQATYRALQAHLPSDELLLIHSRFLDIDRRRLEREIVERLGPDGARPTRLVVVATQVIEQSLDLDFDVMASDVAPMDLLIQRAGRVHRHARPREARPPRLASPRLILMGCQGLAQGGAPVLDPGARSVYGEAALLRTSAVLAELLEGGCASFESPGDVARLVREAYSESRASPAGWEDAWVTAHLADSATEAGRLERSSQWVIPAPGRARLDRLTRLAAGEAAEEARGQAQVRDVDESLPVVVVQRAGGRLRAISWLSRPYAGRLLDEGWIEDGLAQAVARCSVTIPAAAIRRIPGGLDGLVDALEANGTRAWNESKWLRGSLPLVLDESMSAVVGSVRFTYDRQLGLMHATEGGR